MPMTLYFKRAKAFVTPSENDRGTRKFLAQPGPHPQPVPFWVADTETFKQGLKDGSIINLTPPAQMPGYKAPLVAETDPLDEPSTAPEVEDDVEQTEVPTAPFGAQPMTPVAPAPKVGSVTTSTRKRS